MIFRISEGWQEQTRPESYALVYTLIKVSDGEAIKEWAKQEGVQVGADKAMRLCLLVPSDEVRFAGMVPATMPVRRVQYWSSKELRVYKEKLSESLAEQFCKHFEVDMSQIEDLGISVPPEVKLRDPRKVLQSILVDIFDLILMDGTQAKLRSVGSAFDILQKIEKAAFRKSSLKKGDAVI